MFARILQFYTIKHLFHIAFVQCVSITSIVRLECSSCSPKPNKCCMGTFILPNVVLTSSYCADTCQYVDRIPIKQVFIHPYNKNFVQGPNSVFRNDIALVLIGFETRHKRRLVKLSALDHASTIGHRALIPIMEKEKPRLQVTIIQRCIKEGIVPMGYYVCSSNAFTRKSLKVCQERHEQGVPLLLDDRIIGITAINSNTNCLLPQRIFTAIGPVLSWIGSTVRNLGYEEYERDIISQTNTAAVKKFVQSETQINSSNSHSDQSSTVISNSSLVQVPAAATSSSTAIVKEPVTSRLMVENAVLNITIKPIARANYKQLGYYNATLKNLQPNIKIDNTRLSKRSVVTGTTAITFRPLRTATRKVQIQSSTTVTTMKSNIASATHAATTNIMDWFNAKVKDNLKKNPPSFLIVGGPTLLPTRRTTLFVDLT